jgi:hypothetical protein
MTRCPENTLCFEGSASFYRPGPIRAALLQGQLSNLVSTLPLLTVSLRNWREDTWGHR